ncbi:MAG TPA: long-chain fatty acid--CoA ligase, partial [Firmicutes bacterium]|nr:long-chain fatty acid--CoA ligase [Bacillota bacterium]
MTAVEDKRPWLKSYRLGPYRLAPSLGPYPEEPLYSFLDRSAENYPAQTAVDFCGLRINYRELKSYTDSFARALSSLNVRKGDKVVTVLPTCPQYIIANFAILKCGAVHVPCSILHRERELVFEIGESGAETVICLQEQLDIIRSIQPKTKLKNIIITSLADYL